MYWHLGHFPKVRTCRTGRSFKMKFNFQLQALLLKFHHSGFVTGHGKPGKSHVELSYVKNIYTVYHKRDLVLKLKRSCKNGEGHGESHGKSWNVKSSLQTLSLLCILFR